MESKYSDHIRTAYIRKGKKEKGTYLKKKSQATSSVKAAKAKKKVEKETFREKKGRAMPKLALSPELSAFVGAKEMSRGEVTKQVWEYIKLHQLQDPNNKRLIIPDDKLAKLFGSKNPLDMFKMTAVINKHFSRP